MAQKAKDKTEKAQEETEKQLEELANELKNKGGNNEVVEPTDWEQKEDGTISNGVVTLELGDYVNYNCTTADVTYTSTKEKTGHTEDQVFKANEYKYGWRILGVDENNQLMLISEDFVPLTGGGDRGNRIGQYYYLRGQEGYINGVDELNKICEIYGNGNGATSARCIKAEDINKITGYNPNNTGVRDPNQTGSGIKFNQGEIDEHGNRVTYTMTSEGVKAKPANNARVADNGSKTFIYYDENTKNFKTLANGNSITVIDNSYRYYPCTLTRRDDKSSTVGISVESKEYKMLFTNSSTGNDTANSGKTDNIYYWLANQYKSTWCWTGPTNKVDYGLKCVMQDYISTWVGLFITYDQKLSLNCAVRPIVYLQSDIELKDTKTQKDNCKLYDIVLNKN